MNHMSFCTAKGGLLKKKFRANGGGVRPHRSPLNLPLIATHFLKAGYGLFVLKVPSSPTYNLTPTLPYFLSLPLGDVHPDPSTTYMLPVITRR